MPTKATDSRSWNAVAMWSLLVLMVAAGCSAAAPDGATPAGRDAVGSASAGGSAESGDAAATPWSAPSDAAGASTDGGAPGATAAMDAGAGASAEVDAGSSAARRIKWNPGHYMASDNIVRAGGSLESSGDLAELAGLDHQPSLVGYRMFVTWAALETAEGAYDFSIVDATLTYLKTKLDVPKHLVLVVLPGSFTETGPGSADFGTLPRYLQTGSAYGPSPVAGRYGWWGGDGNGNTYAACLHRPAVMARWIALHQALGAAYDGDPSFEAIMFQEDSWIIGASSTNKAPDYDSATNLQNNEQLITATVAAFPGTNVIYENSYFDTTTPTEDLEQFMIEHRVAPGAADTFGQTYIDEHGGTPNGWGMAAFFGLTLSGSTYSGPDYRPRMHSMVDIEGPDLGAFGGHEYCFAVGGGKTTPALCTPADICAALNQSYGTSHAFWTNLGNASSLPASATWNSVLTALDACALTNVGYPALYP